MVCSVVIGGAAVAALALGAPLLTILLAGLLLLCPLLYEPATDRVRDPTGEAPPSGSEVKR